MNKAEVYKLTDLIEEVKKLDKLITIHRQADSSRFMIDQYEAKKKELIGIIIDELASPPVQSTESYMLIKMILEKYYPNESVEALMADSDIGKLAASI